MRWKTRTLVTVGLLGYGAYRLYQKRQAIADLLSESQERLPKIQADLANITDRLADIQAMTPTLEKAGRDLQRHLAHYQTERAYRLETIANIAQKYSPKEDN
ncbi:hypothetical protein [Streptococcus sp. DD12]|uniref:hypothetical protein n=1 Tax=Streptococcus sp. DD12 TaxID=1777880 RepID=UPI000791BFC1|nr:hypothetical protein [Streptococcus sp. DD12]KXT75859.1 hypothetical protein STRDD12_00971 [Streptococcus sp. DD12]